VSKYGEVASRAREVVTPAASVGAWRIRQGVQASNQPPQRRGKRKCNRTNCSVLSQKRTYLDIDDLT
jgi:hypothetical protein